MSPTSSAVIAKADQNGVKRRIGIIGWYKKIFAGRDQSGKNVQISVLGKSKFCMLASIPYETGLLAELWSEGCQNIAHAKHSNALACITWAHEHITVRGNQLFKASSIRLLPNLFCKPAHRKELTCTNKPLQIALHNLGTTLSQVCLAVWFDHSWQNR